MTREEFLVMAEESAAKVEGVLSIESDDFDGVVAVITTGFTDSGDPIEHRLVYDSETGGVQ